METRDWTNPPWPLVKERLDQKRKEAHSDLERATSMEQVWRAQGRLALLRELANLPGTIQALNEEEPQ